MRVSCLQENLNRGLSIVGRAVAARTTLPITNNVLLATDQSRLKLSATNLEIAISCWIGAKVEEEGAITIPARLLTEFVATLPNDRIDMSLSPRARTLDMKCARFEARISGLDAEDFPPIPAVGDGPAATIEPQALHDAITHVVFAAASDDSRPVLTGVHALFEGANLTLAAADGFRLAIYHLPLASPMAEKTEIIIPARSLTELNRLIGDQKEPVMITINPQRSQVLFQLQNAQMISQLIQGTFPNYTQLIPQSYTCHAVVDVAEFLRATRSASIFARDGSGIVRVQTTRGADLTPGKLTVSARAEEIGDNLGEIDATVEGEDAKIAFNGRYLSDVLAVLGEGQAALETTSPSSPGVIRPVGSESYVHIIMPMFVQW